MRPLRQASKIRAELHPRSPLKNRSALSAPAAQGESIKRAGPKPHDEIEEIPHLRAVENEHRPAQAGRECPQGTTAFLFHAQLPRRLLPEERPLLHAFGSGAGVQDGE
jgi:hypothetical protein